MAEQGMNNEGINRLARVMQKRMQTVGESPPTLEIGTIQKDGSLLTNGFGIPIPKADYLVCRSLTIGAEGDTLTGTREGQGNHPHGTSGSHGGHTAGSGAHSHPESEGAHLHDVLVPEKLRSLQPGDTVLVAWVGSDAVVVDILLPATEV